MPDKVQKCIICGTTMAPAHTGMFDDRYGYPGRFDVYECFFCKQMKTVPMLPESEISRLYTDYYPRKEVDVRSLSADVSDLRSQRTRLKSWLKRITNQGQYYANPGMTVLDYGCGAGTSLMETNRLGARCYGIEADENVKSIAAHFKLDIHIGSLSDNPFPQASFDLIMLNQVIEHIPDPVALLEQLFGRLNPDGMMAVSFPNANSIYRRIFGRFWINWHIPYHLHYFNKRSFKQLCNKRGWQIITSRTVTPNIWTILQFRSFFSTPTEGVPNAIWGTRCRVDNGDTAASDVTGLPRQEFRLMGKLRKTIKMTTVHSANIILTLTNRAIDLAGLGDSLIVTIKRKRV